MWINKRQHMSRTVHNSLQSFANFKVDMHNIYIRVRKDLAQKWKNLPFIAIDDAIFTVLETWPPEWCTLDLAELEKAAAQKRKDEAKLRVTQLAEKRHNKKAAAEVRAVREAGQAAAEQKKVVKVVAAAQTTEAAVAQVEEG